MSDAHAKLDPEAAAAIAAQWSLALPAGAPPEEQRAAVLRELTERVRDLMLRDPDKLFQTLYRLDVDEERVQYLRQKRDKSDVPALLADLILKREVQKFLTRKAAR